MPLVSYLLKLMSTGTLNAIAQATVKKTQKLFGSVDRNIWEALIDLDIPSTSALDSARALAVECL